MSFQNFKHFKQFKNKNALSIDYGSKVIGLASFAIGISPFPTPFGKVLYKDDNQACSEIIQTIEDEAIDIVIIGLPTYLDGNPSKMTDKVKLFSGYLIKTLNDSSIKFYFQDEALTSKQASDRMINSPQYNFKADPKEIDAVAACIILEDFIRSEHLVKI